MARTLKILRDVQDPPVNQTKRYFFTYRLDRDYSSWSDTALVSLTVDSNDTCVAAWGQITLSYIVLPFETHSTVPDVGTVPQVTSHTLLDATTDFDAGKTSATQEIADRSAAHLMTEDLVLREAGCRS
jgi:hypothetical protein